MSRDRGRRGGFSFVEVLIASVVGAAFFGSILWFVFSTRVETDKSANYFRALQIAQETLEWAQATPIALLNDRQMALLQGSLVDSQTGKSSTILPGVKISYPDQYRPAYFFRKIHLEEVKGKGARGRFLREIRVEVFWNEGRMPERIEPVGADPDRMKKLTLATLVLDEAECY